MQLRREPTEEHLQEAFAYLREADWPCSLHDLRMAAARLSLVQGKARSIANGGSTERPDLTGPIPAAPASPSTPNTYSARALGHTERRRRDDGAVDLKRLASGDRDE